MSDKKIAAFYCVQVYISILFQTISLLIRPLIKKKKMFFKRWKIYVTNPEKEKDFGFKLGL